MNTNQPIRTKIEFSTVRRLRKHSKQLEQLKSELNIKLFRQINRALYSQLITQLSLQLANEYNESTEI